MTDSKFTSVALLLAVVGSAIRVNAQTTTYEDIGGVRYQVTRQVVPRQIPVVKSEERQVTTYKQQVATENVQYQQVYNVPMTQYQIVPRLHGRWNPFVTPYWTYEYEPVTIWQQQVATIQIPVTKANWTPETRTVKQPVTTWETHNQEIVMKTPIGPAPLGGGANTALASSLPASSTPSATLSPAPIHGGATALASQQYGGQLMSSDPPKSGSSWQPLPGSSVPSTASADNRYR